MGRKRGQGFQLAYVVLGELAEFFAADLAVGQKIFKEPLDVDCAVFSLSNDAPAAKRENTYLEKSRIPRNRPAGGGANFTNGIFRMAGGGANFTNGIFRMAEGGASFPNGIFHMAGGGESFPNGIFRMAGGGANFPNGIFRVAGGGANFASGIFLTAEGGASFSNGTFHRLPLLGPFQPMSSRSTGSLRGTPFLS